MHKLKYLVLFVVVLFMNSCTSIQKKSFISSFDSLIADVESNYKTYKTEDWEAADLKYRQLMDIDYEKYKTSFTDAENSHVNKLIGKYQALKLKSTIISTKNEFGNILEQVGTIVDEIAKDTSLIK